MRTRNEDTSSQWNEKKRRNKSNQLIENDERTLGTISCMTMKSLKIRKEFEIFGLTAFQRRFEGRFGWELLGIQTNWQNICSKFVWREANVFERSWSKLMKLKDKLMIFNHSLTQSTIEKHIKMRKSSQVQILLKSSNKKSLRRTSNCPLRWKSCRNCMRASIWWWERKRHQRKSQSRSLRMTSQEHFLKITSFPKTELLLRIWDRFLKLLLCIDLILGMFKAWVI